MSKPRNGKSTRVVDVRPAGPDHQVVTVQGAKSTYRRKPCSDCPWRKDATGKFPAEAFRHSASTAYDMSERVFSCHQSGSDKPSICAGFLLRGADHNLSVRLKRIKGDIDAEQISDDGRELYEDYRAMAEGNGVDPDDPALQPCR